MQAQILTVDAYRRTAAMRDLSDPGQGPHAMQALVETSTQALTARWGCALIVHRANPVVPIEDNYDRLYYPRDGAARDARYTRYVSDQLMLRTQTSAMIPPLLARLAEEPPSDVLLACPGLVYRRDSIDRLHTGEPHQLDLWRVRRGPQCGASDLAEMIAVVVGALLPGYRHRAVPAQHPYTEGGHQIDVHSDCEWVEVGECGLALPGLLDDASLGADRYGGLAMGLGLDRILMLRKGIAEIRLLRSRDPRVQRQMLDLAPYEPVSNQPALRRDLSIAIHEDVTVEELGDRVRTALGDDARQVEELAVLSETSYADMPPQAIERIGMCPGQKNALIRVLLSDPEQTLTAEAGNALRDRIYAAIHQGTSYQWARN